MSGRVSALWCLVSTVPGSFGVTGGGRRVVFNALDLVARSGCNPAEWLKAQVDGVQGADRPGAAFMARCASAASQVRAAASEASEDSVPQAGGRGPTAECQPTTEAARDDERSEETPPRRGDRPAAAEPRGPSRRPKAEEARGYRSLGGCAPHEGRTTPISREEWFASAERAEILERASAGETNPRTQPKPEPTAHIRSSPSPGSPSQRPPLDEKAIIERRKEMIAQARAEGLLPSGDSW